MTGVQTCALPICEEIAIPHTLRELGVDSDRLDALAQMAAIDPTASGNPVPVGVKELKTLFVASIEGRLD